jgi:hypothetical protein
MKTDRLKPWAERRLALAKRKKAAARRFRDMANEEPALPPPALPAPVQTPAKPPTRAQFREAAQAKALDALGTLAWLAEHASSEAARVSAANSVLDRAHGRPAPGGPAAGDDGADGGNILEVRWLDSKR